MQFGMAKLNELNSTTPDFAEADEVGGHRKTESCRVRTQSRTELRKSWDWVTNFICVVYKHQWVSSKAPECASKMCGFVYVAVVY